MNKNREPVYQTLLPQIESIIAPCSDVIANMANICAVLKEAFDFHWVGFYRVEKDASLILGPFQGPLACVEIPIGKGVCGTAAREQKTILVSDVDQFPGHISCSALSKSEIVVPGILHDKTRFVLDIDSVHKSDFTDVDQKYLEEIVTLLMQSSILKS